MSYETITFEDQLKQIDADLALMDAANEKVLDILLLKSCLWDKPNFDGAISKLQSHLITLDEEAKQPMPVDVSSQSSQTALPYPGQPSQDAQNRQTTLDQVQAQASSELSQSFSYSKAAVISVISVVSAILAFKLIIPPVWFLGILGIAFTFLFFDQVKELAALFKAKEDVKEALTESMRLDNWITESFQWIRERYLSACLLVEVQTNSKLTLPDWALPDTAEGIYNRKLYFEKTLPTEFLIRIDRIVMSCKKNVWARKQVLINAIAVTASSGGGKT